MPVTSHRRALRLFGAGQLVLLVALERRRAAVGAAGQALERAGAGAPARAARPVGTAQLAAGACDLVENAALLGVLAGHDERLPAVARAFARAKFALLGVGWALALLGVGWAYSASGLAAAAFTRLR